MKARYVVIFFLSLLPFVAYDKEEVIIPTTVPRTALICFTGDNSLSGYVSQNLRTTKEGVERDELNNSNLLIYTDKQNEIPQLFQLKVETDTIRQIVLETYDSDQNSASTETLTQIVGKVQKEYPADSYGLVLWSHGARWLSSNIYSYLHSLGQDGRNNFVKISDLASALPKYHFDFILFDAYYMLCAEVAYAFRGCTDCVIGLSMEILTNGFPYQSIMGDMLKKEADVVGIVTEFYTCYRSEAETVSVMKSDELDELATTCRILFHDKTKSDLFAVLVSELQIMEYSTPSCHALYSSDDYVSRLATEEQYYAFKRSMEKAAIYKATAPKAIYAYPYPYGSYPPVNEYSGLSIHVPQEVLPKLDEWYEDLG